MARVKAASSACAAAGCKSSGCKMIKSSTDRALSTSTVTRCCQHQEGSLEQLEGLVLGEASGLDLGLDALDHPALAADLLLLLGHDFTVWM